MIAFLEQTLISYAEHMPLFIFSPVASFIEEIIPIIPSPSIMIAAGSIAQVQGYLIYSLIGLAVLGAFGKTLGACVIYFISDKIENIFSGKFGKFFGLNKGQIESFGAKLHGGPKDYLMLTILRALPMLPSTLLSVGGGLLKIKFNLFFFSTFVGSVFRDLLYIYLGYAGMTAFYNLFVNKSNTVETVIQVIVLGILVVLLAFLYYRKRRG